MNIVDLLKEFLAGLKFPGHAYVMGARAFAAWIKEQKSSGRFCDCHEIDIVYLDNQDNLTKCATCEKPIWAV